MTKRTIYFDLDGTLIDVYERYLGVLNDFLKINRMPLVRKSEYIAGKKRGLREHEIVGVSTGCELDIDRYVTYKRRELEKPDRLRLDTLLCRPDVLRTAAAELDTMICLLTLRRDAEACMGQLLRLGLDGVFEDILIAAPGGSSNPKAEMIRKRVSGTDIIIGDSRPDMECAEMLEMKGYFVRTGLGADPGALPMMNAKEKIFDNVCDVLSFMKNQNNAKENA